VDIIAFEQAEGSKTMRRYDVSYWAGCSIYHFRIYANTAKEARRQCKECMGVRYKDIIAVERADR